MEIPHPRRILAVSLPDSGLLDLMRDLTGTVPSLTTDTVAGTTHHWSIKTNYYTATVPIWLDEITDSQAWSAEFLAPEARDVLTVLGAFVVCFRKPVSETGLREIKKLLENVSEVVKEGCGYSWDGVCLAVAMPQSTTPYLEKSFDEWEELCQESGFEFVDFESKGRNEYSESMGVERLKEALEANEWGGENEFEEEINIDDLEEEEDGGEGGSGLGIEAAEMGMEMFGIKQAIYGGGADEDDDNYEEADQDKEVEKLQAMMLKMQAVKDMGAAMPETERRKFAAKAVNEIMKSL